MATSAGALGTLAPAALGLGLVVFALVVLWKRYVSLGSIVTAACFPLLASLGARLGWPEYGGPWLVLSSAAIAPAHRGQASAEPAPPLAGYRAPAGGAAAPEPAEEVGR